MNYERWIEKVTEICYDKIGIPWFAICINYEEPKQAFKEGQTPQEFIEEYLKLHKPCTAADLFY